MGKNDAWPYEKKWRDLRRNFYGCIKKGLLTENERRVMEMELRRAERDLVEARERFGVER